MRLGSASLIWAVLLLPFFGGPIFAASPEHTGEILVQISGRSASLQSFRTASSQPALGQGWFKLTPREGQTVEQAMAELAGQEGIVTVQPNFKYKAHSVPNDPSYPNQWAPGTINLPALWDKTTGSNEIVVGVIDTGASFNITDLAGVFQLNTGEVPGDLIDNDGNGKVDDVKGWDFVGNDNDPTDDDGHGTFVSSVLGALRNNNLGIAGAAGGTGGQPGIKILPVKALDLNGQGETANIAAAVHYLRTRRVSVINMSLGQVAPDTAMQQAINAAIAEGIIVVASAGNGDVNGNAIAVEYPAAYPNVIAVGALLDATTRVSWSNRGSNLTLMAPGVGIRGYNENGTEITRQGTSFSAPYVAGIVGLLRSMNPSLNPADMMDLLKTTAVDLGPAGFDVDYGHGRVDAQAALIKLFLDSQAPSIVTTQPSAGGLTNERQIFLVQVSDNYSGVNFAQSTLSLLRLGETQPGQTVALQGGWLRLSLSPPLPLDGSKDGALILRAALKDFAGNHDSIDLNLTLDSQAPGLVLDAPPAVVGENQVWISGSAWDLNTVTVTINGVTASLNPQGTFGQFVPLAAGENTLTVVALDAVGNQSSQALTVVWDQSGPAISEITPPENGFTSGLSTVVGLVAHDEFSTVDVSVSQFMVDGNPCLQIALEETEKITCAVSSQLSEGAHYAAVTVFDGWGNSSFLSWSFVVDNTHPVVTMHQIPTLTKNNQALISGTFQETNLLSLTVGGVTAFISGNQFTKTVDLAEGPNVLDVVVSDKAGNRTTVPLTVTRDTLPPSLSLTSPSSNGLTNQNPYPVKGFTDGSQVFINNVEIPVNGGAFSHSIVLSEGVNTVQILAKDLAGNAAFVSRQLTLDLTPPVFLGDQAQALIVNSDTYQLTIQASGAVLLSIAGQLVSVTLGNAQVNLSLTEGLNLFEVVLLDQAQNKTNRPLAVYRTPQSGASPVLELFPIPNSLSASTVLISGAAFGPFDSPQITVQGQPASNTVLPAVDACAPNPCNLGFSLMWFSQSVPLSEGPQLLTVSLADGQLGLDGQLSTFVDRTAPALSNLFPGFGSTVKQPSHLTGITEAGANLSWAYGSGLAGQDGKFQLPVPGSVQVVDTTLAIRDALGNENFFPIQFEVDTNPPVILAIEPASGSLVGTGPVVVKVFCEDCVSVSFLSHSAQVTQGQAQLAFSLSSPQVAGSVVVTDASGNTTTLPYALLREEATGNAKVQTAPGWQLLSLGETSLAQVQGELGNGGMVLTNHPVNGYQFSEGNGERGKAYWVYREGSGEVFLTLPTGPGTKTIDLLQGWNLVAFPVSESGQTGLLVSQLKVLKEGQSLGFSQAQTEGWIGEIFLFNGESYETPVVIPWLKGFWLYAQSPVVLSAE